MGRDGGLDGVVASQMGWWHPTTTVGSGRGEVGQGTRRCALQPATAAPCPPVTPGGRAGGLQEEEEAEAKRAAHREHGGGWERRARTYRRGGYELTTGDADGAI